MFCAKKGKIESHQLPPCRHCLRKHIDRANYQALIWKNCLKPLPTIPEPEGHGWKIENGDLVIDWTSIAPAPDTILELLSCNCARSCNNNCVCVTNGLRCTDMFRMKNCSNMADEGDDSDSEEDDDESGESSQSDVDSD